MQIKCVLLYNHRHKSHNKKRFLGVCQKLIQFVLESSARDKRSCQQSDVIHLKKTQNFFVGPQFGLTLSLSHVSLCPIYLVTPLPPSEANFINIASVLNGIDPVQVWVNQNPSQIVWECSKGSTNSFWPVLCAGFVRGQQTKSYFTPFGVLFSITGFHTGRVASDFVTLASKFWHPDINF